jgi:hypothetical protein
MAYQHNGRRGRMTDVEREQLRAAVLAEIAVDPRGVAVRVVDRMKRRHGWSPSPPTVTRFWREIVEEGGNEEPSAVPPPAVEEVAVVQASAGATIPIVRDTAPPPPKPRVRVRPDLVTPLPPPAAATISAGSDPAIAALRLQDFNFGFMECYRQMLSAGLSLPPLAYQDSGTGVSVLSVQRSG